MSHSPYALLLVERHRAYAEALTNVLQRMSEFDVIGVAVDLDEVRQIVGRTSPALIAFDVGFARQSLSDEVASLSRISSSRLIAMASRCDEHVLEQAVRLRIQGLLLKTDPLEQMILNLGRAVGNEPVYSHAISDQLTRDSSGQLVLAAPTRLSQLSDLQLQVLQYFAYGLSIKEIALRLHITYKSADSHKYRIMRTLGIRDRMQFAEFARQTGLISAESLLECA